MVSNKHQLPCHFPLPRLIEARDPLVSCQIVFTISIFPMLITVAVRGKIAAAGLCTWPQWFAWHADHPKGIFLLFFKGLNNLLPSAPIFGSPSNVRTSFIVNKPLLKR